MPEGDTIFKVAQSLAHAFVGQPLIRAHMQRHPSAGRLRNAVVVDIRPMGKHLLIALDDLRGRGLVAMRVHLGLDGSWFLYTRGQRWQQSPRSASVILSTQTHDAVCFQAQSIDLGALDRLVAQPPLSLLGPDLLSPNLDLTTILARAAEQPEQEIAQLLLDQSVACGIGNIYKSEVLFIERIHPWARVGDLHPHQLEDLYLRAQACMEANLGPGPRVTTRRRPGEADVVRGWPRHWVYGREDRRCLRCELVICSKPQGPEQRWTYWCPLCQPGD